MTIDDTHDPGRRSWVAAANLPGTDFPIQNLPFCIFRDDRGSRGGIGIGDQILDLEATLDAGLLTGSAADAAKAASGATLNGLMALGPKYSTALRAQCSALLSLGPAGEQAQAAGENILVPMARATLELPAFIRSFSDFTSSAAHTRRLRGTVPDVLMRLPVAYNGRASSIRPDGTPVRRPYGQYKAHDETVAYGPEPRLDFELELAAFVGTPNRLGEPVSIRDAAERLFGFVLLNDWSARGIQLFENMLGPFLGKSFVTTISPWIVTREALAPFRVPAVARDTAEIAVPAHLCDETDRREGGLALDLTADYLTPRMRGAGDPSERIVVTDFAEMIWTFAQMLAHHSSNGCNLEAGDLLASGTISGAAPGAAACMAEINDHGRTPLRLRNGETRTWIEDGDEVTFRARASRDGFVSIGFGTCSGRIEPAVTRLP